MNTKTEWHIICLCLETQAFHYCVYEDILFQIRNASLKGPVSICWDSNILDKTIYRFITKEGKETEYHRKPTLNLKHLVGEFVSVSKSLYPSHPTILLVYIHGNVWFYRHREKIHSFQNLFSECKETFDVIFLDSCYVASIEMCLDMKPYTNYLVASEFRHSKMTTITSRFLSLIDTCHFPEEVALLGANEYINKLDQYEYPETILDTYSDISVLRLDDFDLLYNECKEIDLCNSTDTEFKKAKVCPKRNKNLLNYDVYSIVEQRKENNIDFDRLFNQVVILYRQSKQLKTKKPWAKQLNGLSWSPSPWDSDSIWTYKYTTIYQDSDKWTI